MGATTKIQWTDHTFNPWRGCQKVAAGCAHCYADAQAKRNPGTLGVFGPLPYGRRVVASEAMWREPLKWNRRAAEAGERHRVFCASMADVFEDWNGWMHDSTGMLSLEAGDVFATMDDCRHRLFQMIDDTPNLDWLLLTKRPENVRRMWSDGAIVKDGDTCWPDAPRENVWLGCSVATQADADRNIPELLKCRDLARVLFLSVEPLIEQVVLPVEWLEQPSTLTIIGGESGSNARPCNVAWIRSLVEQCRAAGVPCFVKQLGSEAVSQVKADHLGRLKNGALMGEKETSAMPWRLWLDDSKGGDPSEWPEDIRVREFPR